MFLLVRLYYSSHLLFLFLSRCASFNGENVLSTIDSGVLTLKNQNNMTLSYFTGEKHGDNFEQILHLAKELGYSVRVYESKESNQFDFMQAVYRDTAIIVDATIPDDLTLSTVYPLLTAHVNSLDHILVFSEKQYEDGSEVLPLNITPKRTRNKNEDLLEWLEKQLIELKDESLFDRFVIESPDVVVNYMKRMEGLLKSTSRKEVVRLA